MSFTGAVKRELSEARPAKPNLRQAQAYGMFALAHAYSPDEIALSTESAQVADKYRYLLRAFAPRGAVIEQTQKKVRGKLLYQVRLPGEKDRRALLGRMMRFEEDLAQSLTAVEECGAFLAGAFLACGNITDPQKGYHLEFAVREQPLAESLLELLQRLIPGGKVARRRALWIVYHKGRVQIQDLLALMGASRASLAVIEVDMLKEVRNHAMRVTNCETANIDKTIRAAASQVADIELVLREKGLLSLPEELREAALIRLENPELSLRDLLSCFACPPSRSAVFRRLDKLSKIADAIRESGAAQREPHKR